MTKQRPILFNATNVRAVLDGSKTQTRRVVKPQPDIVAANFIGEILDDGSPKAIKCPHGQVGDQLWVYAADYSDNERPKTRWKPSIFMPRAASRIILEITSVRVERLQDITRGDCMAEGCPFPNIARETDPKQWYRDLWKDINGADSWDLNPWVWVIEFKKIPQ